MGSKMSSLSCAPCRSHRRKLKRRPRRSYVRNMYGDSFYESIPPSAFLPSNAHQHFRIQPINSRSEAACCDKKRANPSISVTRTFSCDEHQSSFTYQKSRSEEEGKNPKAQLRAEKPEVFRHRKPTCNSPNPATTQRIPAESVVEISECPEISTISMRTSRSHATALRNGLPTLDTAPYPVNIITPDEQQSCHSQAHHHEQTSSATTPMTVPPNSVNSFFISVTGRPSASSNQQDPIMPSLPNAHQTVTFAALVGLTTKVEFCSSLKKNEFQKIRIAFDSLTGGLLKGIAPLESLPDAENNNVNNDSVFAPDPGHDAACYYADLPPSQAFRLRSRLINNHHKINNNNSSLLPPSRRVHCNSVERVSRSTSPLNQNDPSGGPGLDSDFGASAGVEMRIVSSDCSAPNDNSEQKALIAQRISMPENRHGSESHIRPRNSVFSLGKGSGVVEDDVFVSERYLPMIAHFSDNGTSSFQSFIRPRPATVSGYEVSSPHVTMEWDPYDYDYGANHWMEYYYPRVAYPHRPLLCQKQFWV